MTIPSFICDRYLEYSAFFGRDDLSRGASERRDYRILMIKPLTLLAYAGVNINKPLIKVWVTLKSCLYRFHFIRC